MVLMLKDMSRAAHNLKKEEKRDKEKKRRQEKRSYPQCFIRLKIQVRQGNRREDERGKT